MAETVVVQACYTDIVTLKFYPFRLCTEMFKEKKKKENLRFFLLNKVE